MFSWTNRRRDMTTQSQSVSRVACLRHAEVGLGGRRARSTERNNQTPACSVASNLRSKQRMPASSSRSATLCCCCCSTRFLFLASFRRRQTIHNAPGDVSSLSLALFLSLSRSLPSFEPGHRVSSTSPGAGSAPFSVYDNADQSIMREKPPARLQIGALSHSLNAGAV
uniref:Uncharacterized protein n=1 Tax=Plectus sambesii TaxID=2011161 RepID=A0A914WXG1_9BILA